ncbi:unnamed protein product [Sphacelaria rigidula]
MPLVPEAQEVFGIVTPDGFFTPTRVPQGLLNATVYFQGVLTDIFSILLKPKKHLALLDEILGRLESVDLFVAAHKCTFFVREVVWCGKVYSKSTVSHDSVHIQGLSNMRRPQTASRLMQFLQAVNWLRTSLPRMADVVSPLRVFLKRLIMVGASRRTKRVARIHTIPEDA